MIDLMNVIALLFLCFVIALPALLFIGECAHRQAHSRINRTIKE